MFIGERIWNKVDWGKSKSGGLVQTLHSKRHRYHQRHGNHQRHCKPLAASCTTCLSSFAPRWHLAAISREGPGVASLCGVQHSLRCCRAHQGSCWSGFQDCGQRLSNQDGSLLLLWARLVDSRLGQGATNLAFSIAHCRYQSSSGCLCCASSATHSLLFDPHRLMLPTRLRPRRP